MTRIMRSIAQRAMGKFMVGDDCWEWTASRNDGGYGQISTGRGKNPARAHRVIYELLVGPIPTGLTLDHLCRNRACVNPSHLEPVTRGENVRRGGSAEATRERRAAQTHCKRGHEFTEENTYLFRLRSGSLARTCRACRVLRQREWNQRRGEPDHDR